jgi:hypothetical protein
MFWDPQDELKRAFFRDAHRFLTPNGRIYFGWANFADIDVTLPFRLAEEHGYTLVQCVSRLRAKKDFAYSVLTFKRK